ncbi:MAG: glycoside hydrolase family 18 protein [Nitrososphaerales archaeon]
MSYVVYDSRYLYVTNPWYLRKGTIHVSTVHPHHHSLLPLAKRTMTLVIPYQGKVPKYLDLSLGCKAERFDRFFASREVVETNVVSRNMVSRKVVYISYDINWADPTQTIRDAVDAGFTDLNLAFYIGTGTSPQPVPGPADMAYAWQHLTPQQRQSAVDYATDRGARIYISAGGATDTSPYLMDPVTYASNVCNWALANNLQNVDYDLEYIQNGFTFQGLTSTQMYQWFQTLYQTSRQILGPQGLVSAAPQAPYLAGVGNANSWPGIEGGYVKVFRDAAQDGIGYSHLNIQFYNQGNFYTTYEEIFTQANPSGFPYSAINQLGLPLDRLVYGTYLQAQDGSGFHDPTVIRQYFTQAENTLGWNAGSMLWMWRTSGTPTAVEWYSIMYGN